MFQINDEVFVLNQGIIEKGVVIGTQQTTVRGCSVLNLVLIDFPTRPCSNVKHRPPLDVFQDYPTNTWNENHVFETIEDLIKYLKESYALINGIKTADPFFLR